MLRLALAEIVGTFIIVFIGTAGMVANEILGGNITHYGVCFIWGIAVFLAIIIAEQIAQGHFNPALTIAVAIKEKLPASKITVHIISQCIGAIIASAIVFLFAPIGSNLGATVPNLAFGYVFLIEMTISFCLLATIEVTVIKKYPLLKSAIIIGTYVFIAALITGPYTGASMNPARTIGPAIVSSFMPGLWVYMIAPVVGMLLGFFAFRKVK